MTEPNIVTVIDGNDIDTLMVFWSAALGYRPVGAKGNYRLLDQWTRRIRR